LVETGHSGRGEKEGEKTGECALSMLFTLPKGHLPNLLGDPAVGRRREEEEKKRGKRKKRICSRIQRPDCPRIQQRLCSEASSSARKGEKREEEVRTSASLLSF